MQFMLDTDTSIYVIKKHPERLGQKFDRLVGQICISTITLGELHFGAEKSARRMENLLAIEGFVERLDVLPFSAGAAAHYGQIRAELNRAGPPIATFDMLIGAHARSEGLTLVTGNRREFDRIAGLRIENWL